MAEFIEVMNQSKRMCDLFKCVCKKCPISLHNNGTNESCDMFIMEHPQEAEETIMKWAEEHPIKTNADKFKEVFGYEVNGFWLQEYKEPSEEK